MEWEVCIIPHILRTRLQQINISFTRNENLIEKECLKQKKEVEKTVTKFYRSKPTSVYELDIKKLLADGKSWNIMPVNILPIES